MIQTWDLFTSEIRFIIFIDASLTLPEPVTSRSKVPCQEESRKELVSGHIARIPCAGDALAAATKLHV